MDNVDTGLQSVFDWYFKLKDPTDHFSWKRPSSSLKFRKEDILICGELKELEESWSIVKSYNYYAATRAFLLRYSESDSSILDSVLPLHFCRLQIFKENTHWKCGFSLSAHEVTIRFITDTYKKAKEWSRILKQHCEVCAPHFHRDYSLGKLIGRKGIVRVHLARSLENEKMYVVKVFKRLKLFESRALLQNFIIMIRLSREFRHEGIINFYECYENDQSVHLVADYIQGVELLQSIKTRKIYYESAAVKIMKSLLIGLSCFHSKHIIHRDLKPENIVVLPGDKIIISDFGLAVKMSRERQETALCGTAGYMAPEMINKDGYSRRADIFSVGILLYVLLTGVSPFAGRSLKEILEKNRISDIQFPEEIWKGVSREGKDLVYKMTLKNSSKRYGIKDCFNHTWFKTQANSKNILKQAHQLFQNSFTLVQPCRKSYKLEEKEIDYLVTSSPWPQSRSLEKTSEISAICNAKSLTQGQLLQAVLKKQMEKAKQRSLGDFTQTVSELINQPILLPISNVREDRAKSLVDSPTQEDEMEIPWESEVGDRSPDRSSIRNSYLLPPSELREIPSFLREDGQSRLQSGALPLFMAKANIKVNQNSREEIKSRSPLSPNRLKPFQYTEIVKGVQYSSDEEETPQAKFLSQVTSKSLKEKLTRIVADFQNSQ